ncbi:YciI family protein [Microlunatus flavus]|uniref:YCII-related domain-containing protein n=1 Tax=Microlunatus flavus TaxID=1036181 RepID=A0A1H9L7T1_9ACTN|nr:YciI family protein [Microlunatus flavus]SER07053.1 YCII-related domain-containing protein [Microlunatus flavus]
MEFLLSVIDDQNSVGKEDTRKSVDVFNEQLQADGYWVFAGGLALPEVATVVDDRHGEMLVTDGPFVESKEYLAGFWVVEAAGFDVALRLAAAGSRACARRVEIRPFVLE